MIAAARKKPLAAVSALYLSVLVCVAAAAPLVASFGPSDGDLSHVLEGPGGRHLLGTDELGRDVLSRLIFGARPALVGVAEALIVGLALGVSLGLIAGLARGWVDAGISRAADVVLAIPAIVLILVVLSTFNGNQTAAMLALGAIGSVGVMRVVRATTLGVRKELYVDAARVAGVPTSRIMSRHILPRIGGPVIVQAALFAGAALIVEASLAFLGLGPPPPGPSWGGMVADAATELQTQPWLMLAPGMAIIVTMLALCLLGDGIHDLSMERWAGENPRQFPVGRRPSGAAKRPGATAFGEDEGGETLLSVRNLSVVSHTAHGDVLLVDDVSFDVLPGQTIALVGESGCGKTMTMLAITGLVPAGVEVIGGQCLYEGRNLLSLRPSELRAYRGREIAMISQDPMDALDPAFTAGAQVAEITRRTEALSRHQARRRATELFDLVGLSDPPAVAQKYPHQLSGGMAQRVTIAAALAGHPRLLIADEPTTALDVTIQADILDLLRDIQRRTRLAILLVSHDWGVVADLCHYAAVMYAGEIVEYGELGDVMRTPLHPYADALLNANPASGAPDQPFEVIPGSVPTPGHWPTGCRFAPRCSHASTDCTVQALALANVRRGHGTRCMHYERLVTRVDDESR